MDIKRVGSRPSGKGPEEWFTGSVRIDPPGRRGMVCPRRETLAWCIAHHGHDTYRDPGEPGWESG